MNCPNCGTQIDPKDVFCPNCGAQISSEDKSKGKDENSNSNTGVSDTRNKKVKLDKKLPLIAIVICVIAVIAVFIFNSNTINLEKLVTVEFYGYNTVGSASAHIDEDELYSQLEEKIGKSEQVQPGDYFYCMNTIQLSIDNNDSFSNGDEGIVNIIYDNDDLKDYGIKFKGDSVKFTVEGLEDLYEFDPFEYVEVTFSGISPAGYVEYTYSGDT